MVLIIFFTNFALTKCLYTQAMYVHYNKDLGGIPSECPRFFLNMTPKKATTVEQQIQLLKDCRSPHQLS